LSDIALEWLIEKAKQTGLQIKTPSTNNQKPDYEFSPNHNGELRDSRTLLFKILPASNRDYINANKRKDAKGNNVLTFETFDDSIYKRMESNQNYKHLLPKPNI